MRQGHSFRMKDAARSVGSGISGSRSTRKRRLLSRRARAPGSRVRSPTTRTNDASRVRPPDRGPAEAMKAPCRASRVSRTMTAARTSHTSQSTTVARPTVPQTPAAKPVLSVARVAPPANFLIIRCRVIHQRSRGSAQRHRNPTAPQHKHRRLRFHRRLLLFSCFLLFCTELSVRPSSAL